MIGEEYRVGDFAHGLAPLAAFALHRVVGLILGDIEVALQYPLGAVNDLAGFEAVRELEIFGLQAGMFDFGANKNADSGGETALEVSVV
jgi:hypothetical protein